jgi:rubrerythrin
MNTDKNIVVALANNELMVHNLYRHYAELFPDLERFWNEIADDETKHYEILNDLNELGKKGEVNIAENRFKVEMVEFVRKYLEERIAEQNPSQRAALSNASNIENSLLEKDIFKIFETDAPALKTALDVLQKETTEHLEAVQAKYAELYSGQ